eukprot:372197_1
MFIYNRLTISILVLLIMSIANAKDINYDIYNQWKQETHAIRSHHWGQHHNSTLRDNNTKYHIYVNTPEFLWTKKFQKYKGLSRLHPQFRSTKQSMKDIVSNLPDSYVKIIKTKLQNDRPAKKSSTIQTNHAFTNYNNTINTNTGNCNIPLSIYQQPISYYSPQYYPQWLYMYNNCFNSLNSGISTPYYYPNTTTTTTFSSSVIPATSTILPTINNAPTRDTPFFQTSSNITENYTNITDSPLNTQALTNISILDYFQQNETYSYVTTNLQNFDKSRYTFYGNILRQKEETKQEIESVDNNINICYDNACQNASNLYCCDGCPNSFCIDCISSDNKQFDGKWYCKECKNIQDINYCQSVKMKFAFTKEYTKYLNKKWQTSKGYKTERCIECLSPSTKYGCGGCDNNYCLDYNGEHPVLNKCIPHLITFGVWTCCSLCWYIGCIQELIFVS